MAGIEYVNVCKNYDVSGRSIEVLRGVNMCVPQGAITVILGKSGCGKTTLLRLTGGLEKPDSGEIRFDMANRPAFVFQEPRLMPWLNVWDNAAFGLKRADIDADDLRRIIRTVGLSGFERAYPLQLSGGMQQRVALARALAYHPSFIMMDEPFAALDYFTREQMQQELLRVQRDTGASILFVSHSIDEALLLARRIAIISEGRISAEFDIDAPALGRNVMNDEFISLKRAIIAKLDSAVQSADA